MAGAGYKLFNTGDVLTAAQVNTYLQEQTVMVFASSAARSSALSGVLAEGMVSYLQDTNAVEVYNGTAWVGVSGAGDVTEVQAGTGISVASGTGPIPVVTNTMATAIDAAGDLIYGPGADTFARLGIGTAGQVLKVNSGATAPEWAAPAAGGKVLQVVQASTTTSTTVASTSYTDTTLTATITPTSATSTILVMVSQFGFQSRLSTSANAALQIVRGATSIYNADLSSRITAIGATEVYLGLYTNLIHRDSPNTTSATTYKTQGKMGSTADSGQIIYQDNSAPSTITLLEIGA